MKAALLLLTAAGAALAQNLAGIPACATGCLSSAISAAGCNPSDQGCQCGPTSAAIGSLAAVCLVGSCNAAQLVTAQSVGSSLCAAYSLTATASASTTAHATTTTAAPTTTSAAPSSTTSAVVSSTTSKAASSSTTTTMSMAMTTSASAGSNSTVTTAQPVSTISKAGAGQVAVGALAAFIGAFALL